MSDVIESPFIGQANVTICCQVSINYPNISFSVAWVDQELNVLSGYSTAVTSSSNSTALIKAEPKNPGVYTCVANFSQSYVFNETYTLVLQGMCVCVLKYVINFIIIFCSSQPKCFHLVNSRKYRL